jgi:hypothetical protein
MSDLLRDIDEAMRIEKLTRLWNEHKTALIAGVTALILGTAAHTAWNSWDTRQKSAETTALLTALEAEQPLPELEKLAERDHKPLTLMMAAAHALSQKKYDEAISLYTQVEADRKAPDMFRDLAIVQIVNLSMDHNDATTADELLQKIDTVAGREKSPWQGQALFARATVKAHKSKDIKGAIGDLELVMSKSSLPSSLRQRAQALIDTYRLKDQS